MSRKFATAGKVVMCLSLALLVHLPTNASAESVSKCSISFPGDSGSAPGVIAAGTVFVECGGGLAKTELHIQASHGRKASLGTSGPNGSNSIAVDIGMAKSGPESIPLSISNTPQATQYGGHFTVTLSLKDKESAGELARKRFYFIETDSGYSKISFQSYANHINIGTETAPALEYEGYIQWPTQEEASLSPWDNPDIPQENLAKLGAPETGGGYEAIEAPVSGIPSKTLNGESAESLEGGCSLSTNPGYTYWSFLVFILALTIFRAVLSRRRLDRITMSNNIVGLLLAILCLVIPDSVMATTHTVYGYVSVWDDRPQLQPQGTSGTRLPWCDETDSYCHPNDADCCYRGIPQVQIVLYHKVGSTYAWADSDLTSGPTYSGFYSLSHDGWYEGALYRLAIRFIRDYNCSNCPYSPFEGMLTSQYGTNPYFIWLTPSDILLPSSSNYIPNMSLNTFSNPGTFNGDIGHFWKSTTEAAWYLEEDGETRLRRKYDTTSGYDDIILKYYDCSDDPKVHGMAYCGSSELCVDPEYVRKHVPAHELGHHLQYRVSDCNFPQTVSGTGHIDDGSEGEALRETVSVFLELIWKWDPDVAIITQVEAADGCARACPWFPRDPLPCLNTNDVSHKQNNALALWDFVDDSSAGADQYSDYVDMTIQELMNAHEAFHLSGGSPGENRKANEINCVEDIPFEYCSYADHCDVNEICFKDSDDELGTCHSGDCHGSNIRDWAYYMALEKNEPEVNYWRTLVSSPCVGVADNGTDGNLTGGYHSD